MERFLKSRLATLLGGAFVAIQAATLLFMFAANAHSASLYLRTPGTGFCTVTGATNATPIRVTVSDITVCRKAGAVALANGDKIVVHEVEGNLRANVGVGTSSADTTHKCRTIRGLSGNSFDLYDCPDTTAVAGSGAYASPVTGADGYVTLGKVGHATSYTIPDDHGVGLDGAAGTFTVSLSDTSGTGRKNAANPIYTAMQNISTTHVGLTQAWGRDRLLDQPGQRMGSALLRWLVDGNTAARDTLLFAVRNPDQHVTTFCDTALSGCGQPEDEGDYTRQETWGRVISAMLPLMTGGEQTALANYFLNDLSVTVGGNDYVGAAHTVQLWKIRNNAGVADTSHGTASITSGTTTITGVSTNWNTATGQAHGHSEQLVAGDIIYLTHPASATNAEAFKIVTVNSNTSLTVAYPARTTWSGTAWAAGPAYGGGTTMGAAFVHSRYHYQWSTPNSARNPAYNQYQEPAHNLSVVGILGEFELGLALCPIDPRGCSMAARAYNVFYDEMLRTYMVVESRAGSNPGNMSYNGWRNSAAFRRFLWDAKLATGINLCPSIGDFCVQGVRLPLYMSTPSAVNSRQFFTMAENGAGFVWNANFTREALYGSLLAGLSDVSVRGFWDLVKNRMTTFDTSFPGNYSDDWYLGYDPGVAPLGAATTSPSPGKTNVIECTAIWGAARCLDSRARMTVTSRVNWTDASAFVLAYTADSGEYLDHGAMGGTGKIQAYKAGKVLVGDDTTSYYGGTLEQRGHIYLNSTAQVPDYPTIFNGPVYMPQAYSDAETMYSRANLTGFFKAGATASNVWRSVIHFKSSDYWLVHDYITQSTPGEPWAYFHFPINGCGTPTSSSCLSVSRSGLTVSANHTTAGLYGKFFGVGGAIRMTTESASDTDLDYTGQGGLTGRIRICPDTGSACSTAASSAEWIGAFKSTSGAGSLPTIVQISSGSLRGLEIQDGSTPVVAAFTAGGTTVTSGSFTTTHAGTARYLVAGLTAGSYTISGGSGGSCTVIAGEHTCSFASTSGAISLAPGGGSSGPGTTTRGVIGRGVVVR